MIGTAWNLSYLFGIFTCIALFCLAYAFALDDFSVQYVAHHSNSQLPIFFKVSATWGGHEGSMLFWLFALALWLMLFAFSSRHKDPIICARALSVLGLICFGFCLFILFLSNPFERSFPQAFEGRDLNPMLQDVGLIFHPPLLYLGYVGFAVNFAITISALVSGHLDAAVARMMRPWVLAILVIFNFRDCVRVLVGVLRTRLGRLVVLGSGRKRLIDALVIRFGTIT